MTALDVQQELAISFPMKGVWTSPVLKGRSIPFYALLRMPTKAQAVPGWETYANSCVKTATAKLIQSKKTLTNYTKMCYAEKVVYS